MGRLEALTALALGRGHYEDEVIWTSDGMRTSRQRYNARGHPTNPETRRRERENIRAANEVMQVTGVVEDTAAARAKASEGEADIRQESFVGLRLLELGHLCLVGGVWGVLGLRRRILLYKPYAAMRMLTILQIEKRLYKFSHLLFSGLPSIIASRASESVYIIFENFCSSGVDENGHSSLPSWTRVFLQEVINAGFTYILLHLRLFAIIQQLNLAPQSILPSMKFLIPFSATSPLQFSLAPIKQPFLLAWSGALCQAAAPLLVIFGYGKIRRVASALIYRHIYTTLPRPKGRSIFSGLPINSPAIGFDTPDQMCSRNVEVEPTLRSQGAPPLSAVSEAQQASVGRMQDFSDGEEGDELVRATLISFDVEATDTVETSTNAAWSAELRSANETKPTNKVQYRVTGLTLLPTMMATEGLSDILADVLVMPVEALMVRIVGRVYRQSAGLGGDDLYKVQFGLRGLVNLFSTLTLQLTITAITWAGFTFCTNIYAHQRQEWVAKAEAEKEVSITDLYQ